ncbi:uncharacterized protein LOC122401683 [Colletes gigas]|uniref:uncharacterized protein LOC122401683 n=1 Tax=Colletes gigas TaxID=935657 RepID=UPI001C9AA582|nr:uncharacterized protein LOC122401683 [Colletes gigas]XP_043259901.1 uncharacterized protein LOC122401683 [Colletes gigas]XP_043259902.1 uncharacterized protein LOC122401683 [Colletes gigas]XP_043259903.1 uncharacterized protein LOC122401683 [Colletes gigas]
MSKNVVQPGKLEFKMLTRDKIEEAMMVQAQTMKQECLAVGLGMLEEPGAPEEMQLLFREIVKDGATIIAVDEETDELAAVAFNKIHARPREGVKDQLEIFMEQNMRHPTCLGLIRLLDGIETSVNIYKKYNVNGAMELFYLGTNPRYQGQGIGSQMMKKCIEFGRGLLNGTAKRNSIDGPIVNEHVLPEVIFGVFASNYSQRIAEKLGLESLHVMHYEDHDFAGRKLSERIGDVHRTAKLQALKL